jgi:hypothetical protein
METTSYRSIERPYINCNVSRLHSPLVGYFSRSSNTRLVDEAITLPYQEGSTFYDVDALTEVISNSSRAGVVPTREVLMIRRPPPMPSTALDVRSSDESELNISRNAPEYDGESEDQKRARERRNKLKKGHRHRARQ